MLRKCSSCLKRSSNPRWNQFAQTELVKGWMMRQMNTRNGKKKHRWLTNTGTIRDGTGMLPRVNLTTCCTLLHFVPVKWHKTLKTPWAIYLLLVNFFRQGTPHQANRRVWHCAAWMPSPWENESEAGCPTKVPSTHSQQQKITKIDLATYLVALSCFIQVIRDSRRDNLLPLLLCLLCCRP